MDIEHGLVSHEYGSKLASYHCCRGAQLWVRRAPKGGWVGKNINQLAIAFEQHHSTNSGPRSHKILWSLLLFQCTMMIVNHIAISAWVVTSMWPGHLVPSLMTQRYSHFHLSFGWPKPPCCAELYHLTLTLFLQPSHIHHGGPMHTGSVVGIGFPSSGSTISCFWFG